MDSTIPQRLTVLLVEDEIGVFELTEMVLTTVFGWKVHHATREEQALRLAKETSPDLILMDLKMPHQNGVHITHAFKSDPQTAHLPIIAMSNYCSTMEWRERALEAGCLTCIDKSEFFAEPVRQLAQALAMLSPR